jgi:hypothetical protein
MTVDVWPVETNGQFYVDVTIDTKTERRGPYVDADTAGAMARRLLQFGRALTRSNG